ncbi:MAG TPA: tetratricopeptide repeat protein [Casimicrobiaceae bacterium]|jgi:predicted ATPase/class 3 adenylate cyclase|nr:tetratricopeptide repeat protein [Casimicrobiaceae bacterium]
MQASPGVVTFLFTDIEGSTRLWEQEPERMRPALARHDAIAKAAVERHHGAIVKMAGDGIHAAFNDPLDAIGTTLELQQALADPKTTGGITLRIRCGLHAGVDERRDNDFFGRAVNRAARITSVAHGGQVLLSEAVAVLIRERLPAGVSLRDLGSVRLRDLAGPERIYQVVHPKLRVDFPALRALEATPNNLPQQVTSFIGREHELAEIAKSLGNTRLLTLLGVGGIGKTRLSLQVAADVLDDFPDGVWFVELASLADAQFVPQAVASVLGVKEEAGRPVIEALQKHVKDRRLLLILDNCEHLVEACADVVKQLLQSGPRLKILASSREHLHVNGETTYPVPALAVPDPSRTITPEALTQYESVRLLVDRAVAAQPAFHVTEQNAPAISEICRRLDGIPLAIELAAARVRALSVENIAARLNDRFRLLTSGTRTALPRQQTLRALIDWSYDLLDDRERAVLQRLAVFAGGWTLEAAEAVCVGGDVREYDVLDLLTNLVEKSLVVLEAVGGRYRLLDTVRQYAQERLDESDDADQVRTRHLAFYLALAESASPKLEGPEQGAWLAQLDVERENLLSAHAWCDRAEGGAELGLRLVFSVKLYLIYRGLPALLDRVTLEALARAGAQERSLARCRALHTAGQLGLLMGRYGDAQAYLEESLVIAREIGDLGRVAAVLQALGTASTGQGDMVTARAHFEEALALTRGLGNKRELAAATNALAQLHRMEGELDTAEPLYEKVLALARGLEDRESIAIGLLNLAMVSIGRGSGDRAQAMLLEVLAIAREIGSKPAGHCALEVSAGLGASRKEWERAALFFGAAEAQTAQMGLQRDPADEAFLAPLIAKAREALGEGAFAAVEAAGRALAYEGAMEEARVWLENRS